MEWRYVFPSYHKGGGVSIIFFLGQVLYYMAVLHLKKKKKKKNRGWINNSQTHNLIFIVPPVSSWPTT